MIKVSSRKKIIIPWFIPSILMTPKLPDEVWIYVFSYCTNFYSELYVLGGLSFYFASIVDKYLAVKRSILYVGLIKYHPYDPHDSFWNGLSRHFPLWDDSTTSEDLFVMHICKSLESFSDDQERTEKILFYLDKNKTFMRGQNFHHKIRQFENSFSKFV